MTTSYQCKGCQTIFDGHDPIYFGSFPEPVYPNCPNNPPTLPLIIGRSEGANQTDREHPVGLSVVAVATPKPAMGAWGRGAPIIKTETPEEADARKDREAIAALRNAREKRDGEIAIEARRLVQRMERAIATGGGNVSSNFPNDLQYGTKDNGKPTLASADVINRASEMWLQNGADYSFRAPRYKKVWDATMANFEKLIVSGDAAKGKHNFHVIPS